MAVPQCEEGERRKDLMKIMFSLGWEEEREEESPSLSFPRL